MFKIYIKDFFLTLTIAISFGIKCKVEFNPIDRQFWIYTIWGISPITNETLNKYFI